MATCEFTKYLERELLDEGNHVWEREIGIVRLSWHSFYFCQYKQHSESLVSIAPQAAPTVNTLKHTYLLYKLRGPSAVDSTRMTTEDEINVKGITLNLGNDSNLTVSMVRASLSPQFPGPGSPLLTLSLVDIPFRASSVKPTNLTLGEKRQGRWRDPGLSCTL